MYYRSVILEFYQVFLDTIVCLVDGTAGRKESHYPFDDWLITEHSETTILQSAWCSETPGHLILTSHRNVLSLSLSLSRDKVERGGVYVGIAVYLSSQASQAMTTVRRTASYTDALATSARLAADEVGQQSLSLFRHQHGVELTSCARFIRWLSLGA